MNPYIRKISATNLFVVPILGIGREKLLRNGFLEAFIKDEREIQYECAVYLLFQPEEGFNLFSEKLEIIDEYDIEGYTVLVFPYDKKWKNDIDILMTGKFSQVSTEYKNLIPIYHKSSKQGAEDVITNQHLIFQKAQIIKDYWKKELDLDFEKEDEVWLFYKEREILNKASLKRLTEK